MNTTISVTDTKENLVTPEVNVITQIIINNQAASNDAVMINAHPVLIDGIAAVKAMISGKSPAEIKALVQDPLAQRQQLSFQKQGNTMNNTLKRIENNGYTPITDVAMKAAINSALKTLCRYYEAKEISSFDLTKGYVQGEVSSHKFYAHDTEEGSIVLIGKDDDNYKILWGAGFYPDGEIKQGFPTGPKPINYLKQLITEPDVFNSTNYKLTLVRIHDALLAVNDLSPTELVGADHA